ncbi:Gfo/Idh/MocA family oxidoreductase [Amycolatopsis sp. NPDC005232]|uniref:Gfo/Idh/MocA family protein n=1 Tax=Amycolatopsis sp. NPDC005232 TaxID=3157027 RepID=UPI0033BE097A
MTEAPLRIGLAGAGPWAHAMHAPTFAAGPETTVTAVHVRRAEAAGELAGKYGAVATTDFDELLGTCDAVAFAVRPDIQADLAKRAARAGKAVLLEKPVALTLPAARELAETIESAGVVSQLVLTKRYLPATREFLEQARSFPPSAPAPATCTAPSSAAISPPAGASNTARCPTSAPTCWTSSKPRSAPSARSAPPATRPGG